MLDNIKNIVENRSGIKSQVIAITKEKDTSESMSNGRLETSFDFKGVNMNRYST